MHYRLSSYFRYFLVAFAICTLPKAALAEAGNTWKIGLLVCLSGACSADGTDAMRGARMAADSLNTAGGVLGKKIEFVVQDTNEAVSGAKAVSGYRNLRLDSSVQYIVGPSWTPAGLALAPIVKGDKNILLASPSLGAPEFHSAGNNIFNVRGTDEIASRHEANYAFKNGARKVAILSSQQPWESAQAAFFADEFRKLGGEIVLKEEPLPTATDIKTEVLRIVRAQPDAVFLASVILMGKAARELRDLRFTGLQIGSNIDSMRISESAGALNGAVFYSFQKPTGDFQERFKARHGGEAPSIAAIAYDTVMAFAKAVKKAHSFEVPKAKEAMMTLDFEGASGQIRFDAKGCAIRQPLAWKVAGLSYQPLKEENRFARN